MNLTSSVNKNFEYDCVEEWIKNKAPINYRCLTMFQLNVRGLNDMRKLDVVKEILQRYRQRVDVLILGETWLKRDCVQLYQINGYKSIFSCRDDSHGGLAVFVRSGINFDTCINRVLDGFHHIHLQLHSHNKKIDLHAVYRPPIFDARRFLHEIEQILASTTKSHECILAGDFNIPVNLVANNAVQEYIRLLTSFSMVVSNTSVTRPSSANILDHMVCSERMAGSVVNETVTCELSDHRLIASSFMMSNPASKMTLEKQIIDHRRLNNLFVEFLVGLPPSISAVEKLNCVVDRYNTFLTQCTRTVTMQARVKEHCPWMTLSLWKLIKIKEDLLGKSRRNPNNTYFAGLLERVSKLLQDEKASSKRNYYNRLLACADQKAAWDVINESLGKKRPKSQPRALTSQGRTVTKPTEICQVFNDFFCNVGANLAATINSDRNIGKFQTLNPVINSMFLHPATLNEAVLTIKDLNSNKSPGPDNIPALFVKNHCTFFATLLADVFNEIAVTGEWPDCLKTARITPVFKSGDEKDPSNYRPISCLSVLDKVIEKLLVNRIVNFIEQHNIMYTHQYGFRKGMSTLSATCDLTEDIYDSLDKREIVGALFIDLKKAFDTIDHALLLEKIEVYGIRGVAKALICSYLSDRLNYVSIGDSRSTKQPMLYGVPQGSNLGPILFLLFINDLAKLPLCGKLRLFADDTSVFYHDTSCAAIQRQVEQDLLLLSKYFETNLLSMNLQKTKLMYIHSPRRRLQDHPPVILNGATIEEVQNMSFLGLIIDHTMSWSAHIDSLKSKLSSLCGIIRKLSSFLPPSCLLKIYYCLFHSRLQYLVANWGLATKSRLRELQVLQNRCLKTVFHKPFLYSSKLLYENPETPILPIRALQELQMLVHLRKLATGSSPPTTLTTRRQLETSRSSRQQDHFLLPRLNSEYGRKKISYIGCKLYNALPQSCKSSPNEQSFKRAIRNILKAKISHYIP